MRMKMGDFCKKFDLTPDTIRYYIDEGLLAPRKRNNRYEFSNEDIKDMEIINKYKDLNFSIKQIAKIMSYGRISVDEKSNYASFLLDFYKEKERELLIEKEHIDNALNIIQNDIKDLKEVSKMKKEKIGIPFDFFQYLQCPKCGKPLILNDAEVKNNFIFEGNLSCECSYEAMITDGIIYTPSATKRIEDDFDYLDFKKKYVNRVESKYTSRIYSTGRQLFDEIEKMDIKDKIILEFGGGLGTIFSHTKDFFKNSKYYIFNDIDKDLIKSTKSYIESMKTHPKMIFLCSDIRDIPLKNNSIDYFLNSFSRMEYFFYLKREKQKYEFYHEYIKRLLHKDSYLFELQMFLEKYKGHLRKDYKDIENFFFEDIFFEELDNAGFQIVRKPSRIVSDVTGDVTDFVQEGSNIIMESFILNLK